MIAPQQFHTPVAMSPATVPVVPPDKTKPVLYNRHGQPADVMKNTFQDEGCFLVGGGPSLRKMDLTPLAKRGVLIAAVNNVAATVIRPHLWISVDSQHNFHEAIWRDPAIAKFTKRKYLERLINVWSGNGWENARERPCDLSNCWGFEHQTGFRPESFLDDHWPSWGCKNAEEDPEGKQSHTSVMLPALWLLYWLGMRRVYLLGCDFKMKDAQPYAFEETGKPAPNNELYRWLNARFDELQPHFQKKRFAIANCTPGGKLEAFPRMDFAEAIERESRRIPADPVTRGHYR